MSSRIKRFFSLLLRTVRASGSLLPVASVRQSKTKVPGGAAPGACSHSTPTNRSVDDGRMPSGDTTPSEAPRMLSTTSIGRLPFELLCDCLVYFELKELLPLRLVSKTWIAAVNHQDAYSRDIENMPDYIPDDDMDKLDECVGLEWQTPFSVDLVKARITCSSRLITLHVGTSWLPDSYTEAIIKLIYEHLERIESLWVDISVNMAPSLFDAIQRPVPLLRHLTLRIRNDTFVLSQATHSTVQVPSNIFTGRAPLLEALCLLHATLDAPADYPAFSRLKDLELHHRTIQDVNLPRVLALSPQLESLNIETDEPAEHGIFPLSTTVPIPPLKSLRVALAGQQDQLNVLAALSSPATELVALPVPSTEPRLALWSQLRGLGPFTFYVDSDQSSELFRMHIQLACNSINRVRAVEMHQYEQWEWEGKSRLLEDYEACALAADIVVVELVLRPRGFSPLALIYLMWGDWPAVHTVRVNFLGGRGFPPRLRGGYPALVQVVIFHPDLPFSTPHEDILDICSKFQGFFVFSKTDTFTFVLTRDRETADFVASDSGAASKHPQCIVCSWGRDVNAV